MAIHEVELSRATLHGRFSRELAPVVEIEPGDTVVFQTLDAGWGVGPNPEDGSPQPKFQPRDPERDRGHALSGPVAVRGAQPGMTLEVRIDALRPGPYGWTHAGGWENPVNRRLGVVEDGFTLNWHIDADAGTARDQFGRVLPIRPFMGVMGVAPEEPGWHSTTPPRLSGGNIDCKELVAGTSLYLPVFVPGALFSVGDGHALQGDGESSTTAIECPMERVELTFLLHDHSLSTPRARLHDAWLTLGFDEDLDEATHIALDAMLDLMCELHSLTRLDALALASLLVDLRVTQIVNQVRGAHAMLADGYRLTANG
jgi:acetamidase/formamidase